MNLALNGMPKNGVHWHAGPTQTKALNTVTKLICTGRVFAHYDMSLPTVVAVDASSYGIGDSPMQQHKDELEPVALFPHADRSRT